MRSGQSLFSCPNSIYSRKVKVHALNVAVAMQLLVTNGLWGYTLYSQNRHCAHIGKIDPSDGYTFWAVQYLTTPTFLECYVRVLRSHFLVVKRLLCTSVLRIVSHHIRTFRTNTYSSTVSMFVDIAIVTVTGKVSCQPQFDTFLSLFY